MTADNAQRFAWEAGFAGGSVDQAEHQAFDPVDGIVWEVRMNSTPSLTTVTPWKICGQVVPGSSAPTRTSLATTSGSTPSVEMIIEYATVTTPERTGSTDGTGRVYRAIDTVTTTMLSVAANDAVRATSHGGWTPSPSHPAPTT
jgi:hypothetical protein